MSRFVARQAKPQMGGMPGLFWFSLLRPGSLVGAPKVRQVRVAAVQVAALRSQLRCRRCVHREVCASKDVAICDVVPLSTLTTSQGRNRANTTNPSGVHSARDNRPDYTG